MSLVAVRDYTSAEELIADAQARRAMFYKPAPRPVALQLVVPAPVLPEPTSRHAHPWVEEDVAALRAMTEAGENRWDIAVALKRTPDAIDMKQRKIGVRGINKKPGPKAAAKREEVANELNDGRDWLPIATTGTFKPRMSTVVIYFVCQAFGVSRAELLGQGRSKDIIIPRHIACWVMSKHAGMSLAEIGRRLGGRDHTTARSAVMKIDRMLAEGHASLNKAIDQIVFMLPKKKGEGDE